MDDLDSDVQGVHVDWKASNLDDQILDDLVKDPNWEEDLNDDVLDTLEDEDKFTEESGNRAKVKGKSHKDKASSKHTKPSKTRNPTSKHDDAQDIIDMRGLDDVDIEKYLTETLHGKNWRDEILHPKKALSLRRKTDIFDLKEPFWQYILIMEALARVKRQEKQGPSQIVDINNLEAAESAGKLKKKKYRAGEEFKTDIFDPQKYQEDLEIEYAQCEEIKAWFDNRNYQRENHEDACKMLGILSTEYPRLPAMQRGTILKFWQPVMIWRLMEIKVSGYLKGAIIADSVGLGKTWEAIGFLLKNWLDYNERCRVCQEKGDPYPVGKPNIIIVSPNFTMQWASEIEAISSVFYVYIYYGDIRAHSSLSSNRINKKLSSDHPLFNGEPRNARAIILATYQTLNS
ncbi:hypothetical protein BBP40_009595 [Aspergillus hancockii]|nr:hypothetical protein BBP40_009595 [Aspergillus hancockii]